MQRADVPGRHGAPVERAAHAHDNLALDERGRVGERQRGQAADLVDLQHRNPGLAVVIDQARVVQLGVAREEHGHPAGARDHVHRGHDVTV